MRVAECGVGVCACEAQSIVCLWRECHVWFPAYVACGVWDIGCMTVVWGMRVVCVVVGCVTGPARGVGVCAVPPLPWASHPLGPRSSPLHPQRQTSSLGPQTPHKGPPWPKVPHHHKDYLQPPQHLAEMALRKSCAILLLGLFG